MYYACVFVRLPVCVHIIYLSIHHSGYFETSHMLPNVYNARLFFEKENKPHNFGVNILYLNLSGARLIISRPTYYLSQDTTYNKGASYNMWGREIISGGAR